MRFMSVVKARANAWAFLLSFLTVADHGLAVEQEVVLKSTHATIEDERFSLVGVIAEGDGKGKGIAVIRDGRQNKTHTLKVGELIPGERDLVLSKVSRQAVILHGNQNDIFVGFNANATRENVSDKPDSKKVSINPLSDDDYDDEGPETGSSGLFEKWYQNRGPAVLNGRTEAPGAVKSLDIPGPIRSSRGYSHNSKVDDDDGSSAYSEVDDTAADQTPPKRTEYSEAMRSLIDRYLNSDTPVP